MRQRYRHPYSRRERPDRITRPPMPAWLQRPRESYGANVNALKAHDYWTKMYWATPPWLTDQHVLQMKAIKDHAGPDEHVDHIVPLTSPLVCGLNVPWNLRVISGAENMTKSNAFWPEMPFQPQDMFDDFRYQDFALGGAA